MTEKEPVPEKPRVIPPVPPADRERLNEGVDRPQINQPIPTPPIKQGGQ